MTIIDRTTYPAWFNTRYDAGSPYKLEAQQWKSEIENDLLDTEGIKGRVWANAHQQNVYLESLELRLEELEGPTGDPRAKNEKLQAIENEIQAIRGSSTDDFSDVFNDKLDLLATRAREDHVPTDDDGTGANRRGPVP